MRVSLVLHGVWKAKYSKMTVSEAKRLKSLEDENAKLKWLLAEQMPDMAACQSFLKKMGTLAQGIGGNVVGRRHALVYAQDHQNKHRGGDVKIDCN